MAFEHDQFARFVAPSSSLSSSVAAPPPYKAPRTLLDDNPQQQQHQKPLVMAKPPRPKVSEMVRDVKRRRALIAVGIKLALVCGWLLHELIVGFDESQCLQLVTVSSDSHSVDISRRQSDSNSTTQTAAEATRPSHFGPNASAMLRGAPRVPMKEGQLPSAPSPRALAVENSRGKGPHHKAPKRRRKVILRRRLLRKGATASDAKSGRQQQEDRSGTPRKGIVRRVVWRVVPLKQLPSSPTTTTKQEADTSASALDDGGQHQLDTFPFYNKFAPGEVAGSPVRTKTGTVVMLARDEEKEVEGRRLARRRTTEAEVVAGTAGSQQQQKKDGHSAQQQQHHSHLFHIPLLNNQQHPLPVANVPEQMLALTGTAFCLVRTFFDCWALLQCFCCALFLLGLHLRHRLLALIPIVVDVLSIMLAIMLGLSTLIFVLILFLVARTLLGPPMWLCVGLSIALNAAVALYGWATFCEMNTLSDMSKRRKKKVSLNSEETAAEGGWTTGRR